MVRVPTNLKYYIMFKRLLEKPRTMAELADILVNELNMRYSTARPMVTRLITYLKEYGIVEQKGFDKRGSPIIDLTVKGLSVLTTTLLTYGYKMFEIDPQLVGKAVRRLCPEASKQYEDFTKILVVAEKYRLKESRPPKPYNAFASEFLGYAVELEQKYKPEEYTCDEFSDVGKYFELMLTQLEHEIGREKADKIEHFLSEVFNQNLSDKTKEALRKVLKERIKEYRKELEDIQKLIATYKRFATRTRST